MGKMTKVEEKKFLKQYQDIKAAHYVLSVPDTTGKNDELRGMCDYIIDNRDNVTSMQFAIAADVFIYHKPAERVSIKQMNHIVKAFNHLTGKEVE